MGEIIHWRNLMRTYTLYTLYTLIEHANLRVLITDAKGKFPQFTREFQPVVVVYHYNYDIFYEFVLGFL